MAGGCRAVAMTAWAVEASDTACAGGGEDGGGGWCGRAEVGGGDGGGRSSAKCGRFKHPARRPREAGRMVGEAEPPEVGGGAGGGGW